MTDTQAIWLLAIQKGGDCLAFKNMVVPSEERESVATIMYTDSNWTLYTSDTRLINLCDRLGYKRVKEYKNDGNIAAIEYSIPWKCFQPTKKRQLSSEVRKRKAKQLEKNKRKINSKGKIH